MLSLKKIIFFVFCLCLTSDLFAAKAITKVRGDFNYAYINSSGIRNVKVHYYAPKKLQKLSRIVFVLHGDGRKGAGYRDEWQEYAEKYNFLVLCPEMSMKDFPYLQYNFGNILNPEKKIFNPKKEWTFNLIEQLFDFAKKDKEIAVEAYCIFGHSSGAQFVQRMVLFMPEARFSLAIANGAGWYTLPDFNINFQTGLKGTPVTKESLKMAFEKKMILLMGTKDFVSKVKPASYDEATHAYDRVWRAQYFYQAAKNQSQKMGAKLNWNYKKVQNADHNSPLHAFVGSKYAAKSPKRIAVKKEENK